MGKHLEEVKQRAKARRAMLECDPDSDASLVFMDKVDQFLSQPDGFLTHDAKVSAAILQFLDYSPGEIMEKLMMLTFEQIESGQYTYVDPDWVDRFGGIPEDEPEPELESTPPIPEETPTRYYQSKAGEIFRIRGGTNFQLLRNGHWIDCPSLRSFYFDAASDYWEICEPAICAKEEETRKCPKCGKEAAADHLFCMHCGADLSKRYCLHCGKEIPEYANFCPYCGKKQ